METRRRTHFPRLDSSNGAIKICISQTTFHSPLLMLGACNSATQGYVTPPSFAVECCRLRRSRRAVQCLIHTEGASSSPRFDQDSAVLGAEIRPSAATIDHSE